MNEFDVIGILNDVIDALSHDESIEGILTIDECIEVLQGIVEVLK